MPDLSDEILGPWAARISNGLRVATVGRVGSFVRSTGRAAVNLLMRYVTSDGQERAWPPSPSAVVVQPRGDGYGVAFDLSPQDVGVTLASDNGWEQAWVTGQAASPSDGTRHTYGSAAFFPGGRRGGESPANAAGQMRVGAEDGTASVDFSRARAVPPSLGKVIVRSAGPTASLLLGSPTASAQVAKAVQTKNMVVAGWTAFNATIQADATVAPPLKVSIAAASAAAITAVNLVPIGSVKVVVDP